MLESIKPMDIIAIGAVIVIAGGLIGAYGTYMQNKASSVNTRHQIRSLEELGAKNAELGKDISNLSERNSKLYEELLSARKEVEKARTEAAENTFGGKGAFFLPMVAGGISTGSVYNDEKLPVYDARIQVIRYDEILKCDRKGLDDGTVFMNANCYLASSVEYNIPIIYGNTPIDFQDHPIPRDRKIRRFIKFTTKKGTYYQEFINDPLKGFAYRILEEENEAEHWSKFLNGKFGDPIPNRKRQFKVVKVFSTQLDDISWEEEFPLPIDIQLLK